MKPITCSLPSGDVPRIQHQKLVFLGVSHSAFGAPNVYAIPPQLSRLTASFVRRERLRGRTAEQRDELAPFHVEPGGLPPPCAISAADRPVRSVSRVQPGAEGAGKSLGQT